MSNLLNEIVGGASGSEVPVATLLPKVKVVASRTAAIELESWVDHELDGYPDAVDVPSYRGPFTTEVVGHLGGMFGRELTNAPLPPSLFPADMRDGFLFRITFTQSITELKVLSAGNGELSSTWPADVIAYTNLLITQGKVTLYDGFHLMTATQRLSRAHLAAVIATVRTRVLDLALGLEKLAPTAGMPGGEIPSSAGVASIVNNIYGSANLAISSHDVTQVVNHHVVAGDRTPARARSHPGRRSGLLGFGARGLTRCRRRRRPSRRGRAAGLARRRLDG